MDSYLYITLFPAHLSLGCGSFSLSVGIPAIPTKSLALVLDLLCFKCILILGNLDKLREQSRMLLEDNVAITVLTIQMFNRVLSRPSFWCSGKSSGCMLACFASIIDTLLIQRICREYHLHDHILELQAVWLFLQHWASWMEGLFLIWIQLDNTFSSLQDPIGGHPSAFCLKELTLFFMVAGFNSIAMVFKDRNDTNNIHPRKFSKTKEAGSVRTFLILLRIEYLFWLCWCFTKGGTLAPYYA